MHKFGGTYVDTDIITLKAHPDVLQNPNFVLFEEPGSINGAMMRFKAKHFMLQAIGERLGTYHTWLTLVLSRNTYESKYFAVL